MERTKRVELDALAGLIAAAIEDPSVCIEYAYGSPRVSSRRGSVDLSPRLTAGELARWMRAYLQGIDNYRAVARHRAEDAALATLR